MMLITVLYLKYLFNNKIEILRTKIE